MSAISALPAAVAQWLAEQEHLEGLHFLTEFPAQNKSVPLRRAIVAVGLANVHITDKFVETDDGVLERQEYCRTAALRLRFGIHVPFVDGGDRCHEIFTRVLDVLTFASDLDLRASGCREIRSQRDTDAFVLEAWADVNADFCPAESTGLNLHSFLQKDLLCGSHIGNHDIHLNERQRNWIDQPYRTGTYAGNGAATRVITLGFQPSAVFVSATQFPPAHPNFATQSTQVHMGFAAGEHGSMGVEIAPTGFRVRGGPSVTIGTSIPATNLSGEMYMYFALV